MVRIRLRVSVIYGNDRVYLKSASHREKYRLTSAPVCKPHPKVSTWQLLHVLDTWVKNLEEGGQIDVIYTDFAKAFDKVPHCRLINKLHSYGVNDQLILWIKNF